MICPKQIQVTQNSSNTSRVEKVAVIKCSPVTIFSFWKIELISLGSNQLKQSMYYLYFSSIFPSKAFTDVEDKQGGNSQALFIFKVENSLSDAAGFMGILIIKVNIWMQCKYLLNQILQKQWMCRAALFKQLFFLLCYCFTRWKLFIKIHKAASLSSFKFLLHTYFCHDAHQALHSSIWQSETFVSCAQTVLYFIPHTARATQFFCLL